MPPSQHLNRSQHMPSPRTNRNLRFRTPSEKIIWNENLSRKLVRRTSRFEFHIKRTVRKIERVGYGNTGSNDGRRTDKSFHCARPVFKVRLVSELKCEVRGDRFVAMAGVADGGTSEVWILRVSWVVRRSWVVDFLGIKWGWGVGGFVVFTPEG